MMSLWYRLIMSLRCTEELLGAGNACDIGALWLMCNTVLFYCHFLFPVLPHYSRHSMSTSTQFTAFPLFYRIIVVSNDYALMSISIETNLVDYYGFLKHFYAQGMMFSVTTKESRCNRSCLFLKQKGERQNSKTDQVMWEHKQYVWNESRELMRPWIYPTDVSL